MALGRYLIEAHLREGRSVAELARTHGKLARLMAESWCGGARGFIFASAAPFDRETIERIVTELKPASRRSSLSNGSCGEP